MLLIYLKNKLGLLMPIIAVGLVSANVYADRIGDGPVIVEIKNNNLCFSVNSYKPRGYFIKSFKVGSQGYSLEEISLYKFQRGIVWGQSLPIDRNSSAFNLKSDQCLEYGVVFRNYKSEGGKQNLESGKYRVIISGYDLGANKRATFLSVFTIDVTNGKISLKSIE